MGTLVLRSRPSVLLEVVLFISELVIWLCTGSLLSWDSVPQTELPLLGDVVLVLA